MPGTRILVSLLMTCILSPAVVLGADLFGTLGDSTTDLEIPPNLNAYRPWTQWCAQTIGVNFGPLGTWSDFRDRDYQCNFAHGGATTASMLTDRQHTLLAAMKPPVKVAVIWIGANDLAYHFQNHALWIRFQDGRNPIKIVPAMMDNVTTAVDTVAGTPEKPTGTAMVIFGCPDITRMPTIADNLWAVGWGCAPRYRKAVVSFNDSLKRLASTRGWVYLDVMGLQNSIMGPPDAPKSKVVLAKVRIPMRDMFYRDGIHPGSVFNGLLANLFIHGVNRRYGMKFKPMTDQQILTVSGYAPLPGATYCSIAPYVILPPGPLTSQRGKP